MIGDSLQIYTFDYLMLQALNNVSPNLDKRQGSVIYDALAPACYRLADLYMEMRNIYTDTFATTATDAELDSRVTEQGISRYSATYATKKGVFQNSLGSPVAIAVGSRFATMSETHPIIYFVKEPYTLNSIVVAGSYVLQCETAGTAGNEYTGELLNITFIQGLSSAIMSELLNPARDRETNDELRLRYFERVNQKPFGGNIADYRTTLKGMSGIGGVQIYPIWNGGGTVKCSILDASYNAVTVDFLGIVQDLIDPSIRSGIGLGTAPIGHQVTIVTPSQLIINVTATLTLVSGYTIAQVQTSVRNAIQEYFLSQRKIWDKSDDLNNYSTAIYLSRVNSSILNVAGIANVTLTKLNSVANDLVLTQSSITQQIPILGTVILS